MRYDIFKGELLLHANVTIEEAAKLLNMSVFEVKKRIGKTISCAWEGISLQEAKPAFRKTPYWGKQDWVEDWSRRWDAVCKNFINARMVG